MLFSAIVVLGTAEFQNYPRTRVAADLETRCSRGPVQVQQVRIDGTGLRIQSMRHGEPSSDDGSSYRNCEWTG